MIAWDPLLPLWTVWLVGGLSALAAVHVYRRPSLPAALRLALVAGIAVMLANPVRRQPAPITVAPLVAVVTDCSGSMALADGPAGAVRGVAARAAAAELSRTLSGGWRVVSAGFAGELHTPTPAENAGDSDFASLASLVELTPKPRDAIVISDGADWSGADPETALAAAGIRVHTLGVGTRRSGSNSAVSLHVPSPHLAPGQDLELTAELTATPELVGREADLVIESVDDEAHPQELLRTRLTLAAWQRVPVTVGAGDALGGRLWRARIAPVPGEASEVDNTAWASAQVVDRTLRIQVLEGRPCWDTTFAVRAWRRDRQVAVSTAYAVGATERRTGEAAVPPTADSLGSIEVLVLGQDPDGGSTALGKQPKRLSPPPAVLKAWVDSGGRLILLGTAPIAGTEDLDPLELGGAPQPVVLAGGDSEGLLPAGKRFPALAAPAALRPQARVLLGTRQAPLIALRRIGGGAVCRINLDGFWRWHLAGGGREAGERFCRQLLRSVARSPAGDLWAERLRLPVGESAALWTRPDAGVTAIEHVLPDGTRRSLRLSDHGARPRLDQPGTHRFIAGVNAVTVVVEQRLGERIASGRDDARLRRLSSRTGGESLDISEATDLARRLTAERTLAGTAMRSEPLITERWWLLTLAALAASEWWIRRRRHGVV